MRDGPVRADARRACRARGSFVSSRTASSPARSSFALASSTIACRTREISRLWSARPTTCRVYAVIFMISTIANVGLPKAATLIQRVPRDSRRRLQGQQTRRALRRTSSRDPLRRPLRSTCIGVLSSARSSKASLALIAESHPAFITIFAPLRAAHHLLWRAARSGARRLRGLDEQSSDRHSACSAR